jgi:pimeloyl-ACP methyl ester carboxylesterase
VNSSSMSTSLKSEPAWLKSLFPWEQRALTVNGRLMAYIDEGDRDCAPVLLLHGNPTWGFLYRDFIEPLKRVGYRVIVPDWVGSGYSDHPRIDAGLTLAHHIADLVSLINQMRLRRFVIVGQDWGGPQGVGAALQRVERLDALVLMNTWLFTGNVGKFHQSPLPWTTWHAPLIGQLLMKRFKVLSHGGVLSIARRIMTADEKRAYHHVFDEPDSDHVVLTWPRTIPLREGDRGWHDMRMIQNRLGELALVPTLLLWAAEDNVFPIEYADRLKELLPHAEGPILFDRAGHFLQDDRGSDMVAAIIPFLQRALKANP